jgi:hypothetical protein
VQLQMSQTGTYALIFNPSLDLKGGTYDVTTIITPTPNPTPTPKPTDIPDTDGNTDVVTPAEDTTICGHPWCEEKYMLIGGGVILGLVIICSITCVCLRTKKKKGT